jgi:hypothetical protein
VRGALVWIAMLVASCAPDFGHTAFLCDSDHRCPDDQMCRSGRCWQGTPPDASYVECDERAGDAGRCIVGIEQCCVSEGGTLCGDAGALCQGPSGLCDGPDDCPKGEQCCADGTTVFCGHACDRFACRADGDCPLEIHHCCYDQGTPWGVCATGCLMSP